MDGEFITQLTAHQSRLLAYIRSLTAGVHYAEEVLQRTNLVLWEKREQFEPGSNFGAWACRVAYFEVLAWRKQQQRERARLEFDDELLERIADRTPELLDQLEPRREALRICLSKLKTAERELLERRHLQDWPVRQLAEKDGRSEKGIYKALARLHAALRRCIDGQLARAT